MKSFVRNLIKVMEIQTVYKLPDYMKMRKELFGMTMSMCKNIEKIEENKMKYDDFTSRRICEKRRCNDIFKSV